MGSLIDTVTSFPYWEPLAVALGIIYLVLATREIVWCWLAAFFSTLIFLFLFWDATLVMQSGLQIYYLAMALYGWSQWRNQGAEDSLSISSFSRRQHVTAVLAILACTAVSTLLLDNYTDSALPLLDSITTWSAVVTTWMVTRKILENWLYWIVIDALSAWLYLERGLELTALLYLAYIIIAILGYRQWKSSLIQN
ncbi:MAG: nicotinamide mononucleotide transporter [Halieaceae bacterium]|jgi:nicotinamide mononucleotide transporter